MGIESTGGIDKPAFEKEWASQEARKHLSPDDRALWDAARYTVRPFVYFDKMLIAWSVVKGQPQIKEVFKVVGVDAGFQDGLWVRMRAEIAKREVLVTPVPRRLLPNLEVFGWVPYFNELRFAPPPDWHTNSGEKKSLRLHLCFKMRSRSDDGSHPYEGHDYLSELHIFRDLWPQYSDTRF